MQLFLYIFRVCIGRRSSEEKSALAARKASSLFLCSRARCSQQAEDSPLHRAGNPRLAFWAQCWAPQGRLRHIGQSPNKTLENLRQFTKMVKGLEHNLWEKA